MAGLPPEKTVTMEEALSRCGLTPSPSTKPSNHELSPPSPTPRLSIPALVWSGCCAIAGITLIVYTCQHYARWSKALPGSGELRAQVEHARKIRLRHFSLQLEWQEKSIGMALTEQQMAKLKEETSQIKREIWQDESAWNNLAEQIDRQQTVLLQAQAEMQFAKSALRAAGVSQKDIENRISSLENELQEKAVDLSNAMKRLTIYSTLFLALCLSAWGLSWYALTTLRSETRSMDRELSFFNEQEERYQKTIPQRIVDENVSGNSLPP